MGNAADRRKKRKNRTGSFGNAHAALGGTTGYGMNFPTSFNELNSMDENTLEGKDGQKTGSKFCSIMDTA